MDRFSIDPRSLSREDGMTIQGPVGSLEGLWRPPRPGAIPRGVVVMAHPHPAFGGSMMNKVVFHTSRVLNHDLDLATLRFNFRGVGHSEGAYDDGNGEVHDLLAAWKEARHRASGLPLFAAGFSFGAAMTLRAVQFSAKHNDVLPRGLALIGIPLRLFAAPGSFPEHLPLAAVHGEKDQFTPPGLVKTFMESWPEHGVFRVEPGADHFLVGRLVEGVQFLSDTLKEWL